MLVAVRHMPRHNNKIHRRRETETVRINRSIDARTTIEHKRNHLERFLRDCTANGRSQTAQPAAEPTFFVTIPRTVPQPASSFSDYTVVEQTASNLSVNSVVVQQITNLSVHSVVEQSASCLSDYTIGDQPSTSNTAVQCVITQTPTSPLHSGTASDILSLSTVSFVSAYNIVEATPTEIPNVPLSRHQRRKLRLRKYRKNNPHAELLSRRERKEANRIEEAKKQASAQKKREEKQIQHQRRLENGIRKRSRQH